MKPRYEIHSIGMPDIVEPSDESKKNDQRDLEARALFSATELVNGNNFQAEFGRVQPQTKFAEYSARYQTQFLSQIHDLSRSLTKVYGQGAQDDDLTQVFESLEGKDGPGTRDAWNTRLRLERVRWDSSNRYYFVRSAGPDKHFDTGDDLTATLEVRRRKIVGQASKKTSGMDVNIAHDRGAFNGRAEIVGQATDQQGAAEEGEHFEAIQLDSGKILWATVDADGRFRLTGLTPGRYRVEMTSGSGTLRKELTLDARDLATISVQLESESPKTVVTVRNNSDFVMFRAGVAGGQGGGVFGGVPADRIKDLPLNGRNFEMLQEALPAAPPVFPRSMSQTVTVTEAAPLVETTAATLASKVTQAADSPTPRVRSYFPEALYINPEIITDKDGFASISVPVADSITTWRLATTASTVHGALGSSTSSLKVFQDFFVDLDLPVTLTQGDRVSVPVAVYNYSGARGDVSLSLHPDDWYSLVEDNPEKAVSVDSGAVGGSQFTIEARRIGKFKLTISANMSGGNKRADIVVREIEVIPNGREQSQVFNGRLESSVQHVMNFPADSIPDASNKIYVRLYPGPLSQVIEGMDSILRMPNGCFEQTSSSTYPNVLALDYMKRTKKLSPEVHAKAEGFIANGYQRLLTFEVPGGGFSWFGSAPANKILTAYGLMEFYDMSHVHDVDPNLISRTQQWLANPAARGRKLEAGYFVHQRGDNYSIQLGCLANYCLHRMVAREHRLSRTGR